MAFSLAQLKYRIIEAPPFWNTDSEFPGSKVKDLEAIEEVLMAAIEAERLFRKQVSERHLQAIDAIKKRLEEAKVEQETEEFFEEGAEKAKKPKKKKVTPSNG